MKWHAGGAVRLLGIGTLLWVAGLAANHHLVYTGGINLASLALLWLYFLPLVVAFRLEHPRTGAILLVNLLLSPLFAYPMLYRHDDAYAPADGTSPTLRSCPACGAPYDLADYRPDASAIRCSRCKSEVPREASVRTS